VLGIAALQIEELITFFGVLVRYGTLAAVLPIVGDRVVPGPVKVLLALALSIVAYPMLIGRGDIKVAETLQWSGDAGRIAVVIGTETLFGLVMGFTARLIFDGINFGANLVGNFMGLSAASTFDPHQETQTQVIAELQVAIATLLFLALDGHHWMLKACLDSYSAVGMGKAGIGQALGSEVTRLTTDVFKIALQLSAPVAVSLFAVNIAFGVLSKAIPQLNVLVLSFAVSALVGLGIMYVTIPEVHELSTQVISKMTEWSTTVKRALRDGGNHG